MAQLVVAGSPYTVYPGGVIALRATDWMGAARGTLSSETDSRAVTGECVRDTQTTATSLFGDPAGAYAAVDDTLTIDLSTIPEIEEDMEYAIFLSYLIEGDWDTSTVNTLRESTQDMFRYACNIAYSVDAGSRIDIDYRARRREHYIVAQFGSGFTTSSPVTEELHVRAYAQSGTTVETLLDQITLLPYVTSGGTFNGEWQAGDFAAVGARAGQGVVVDGPDGGDSNGKFTWSGVTHETSTHMDLGFGDGGGDYQQSPLDEYVVEIDPSFGYPLENTVTSTEAGAHAYSVSGSNYRADEQVLTDTFTRVAGPDSWGRTPQGYVWTTRGSGPTTWSTTANGTQGTMTRDANTGVLSQETGLSSSLGARIQSPSFDLAGVFSCSSPTYSGSGTQRAHIRICISTVLADRSWVLHLNTLTLVWALYLGNSRSYDLAIGGGTFDHKFSSDVDISSWFAFGDPVGFRFEKKRYAIRARLWDASGAEPSTWDVDTFVPFDTAVSGALSGVQDYPYSDSEAFAHQTALLGACFPSVQMGWAATSSYSSLWDDITVDIDPYGSSDDMAATMENAQDVEVGNITVPYGAWQFIHWGSGDFTEISGTPFLQFRSKAINESGAAELQRAEALFWYFRSIHGNLIPMNWRSADRSPQGQNRILAGG